MSDWIDCKNMLTICRFVFCNFNEVEKATLIDEVLKKLKLYECTKSNVIPEEFISKKLFLQTADNKKDFIRKLCKFNKSCNCK